MATCATELAAKKSQLNELENLLKDFSERANTESEENTTTIQTLNQRVDELQKAEHNHQIEAEKAEDRFKALNREFEGTRHDCEGMLKV